VPEWARPPRYRVKRQGARKKGEREERARREGGEGPYHHRAMTMAAREGLGGTIIGHKYKLIINIFCLSN
jgi:hypothetical protein